MSKSTRVPEKGTRVSGAPPSLAPTRVKRWAYAAPAFALAFVGIPVYVYMPSFYTDVVGVDIALVGWLMLGARMFDAVSDPAVGLWSDATRTRFGRRRPFILGASVPLALTIYFLLTPPAGSSAATSAWWFGGWLFAMFLCWTLLVVPYESLGPELSFDYHDRTALLGARDGMLVAGTVLAAAAPMLVSRVLGLPPGAEGERARYFWVAVLYAPLVVLLSTWCVLALRERPAVRAPARIGLRRTLSMVAENRPFLILLSAYTLGTVAFNLAGALLLFYVRYVLVSQHADLFLVIYLAAGVLCLPLWIGASRRIGKRAAWIAGMATYAVGGSIIFFLEAGDETLYGVLCVVTGATFGATVAIPSSMQADTIDYDELLSGRRREGLYVGMWSVSRKMAAALGVGVALPILGALGYQPNVEQTEGTKLALRLLYVGVPVICNLLAIVVARRYPIDRKRHEEIREAIARS